MNSWLHRPNGQRFWIKWWVIIPQRVSHMYRSLYLFKYQPRHTLCDTINRSFAVVFPSFRTSWRFKYAHVDTHTVKCIDPFLCGITAWSTLPYPPQLQVYLCVAAACLDCISRHKSAKHSKWRVLRLVSPRMWVWLSTLILSTSIENQKDEVKWCALKLTGLRCLSWSFLRPQCGLFIMSLCKHWYQLRQIIFLMAIVIPIEPSWPT